MSYDDVRTDIRRLIDWYERFKPEAGQSIPVAVSPKTLAIVLGVKVVEEGQREFIYRGRKLIATG